MVPKRVELMDGKFIGNINEKHCERDFHENRAPSSLPPSTIVLAIPHFLFISILIDWLRVLCARARMPTIRLKITGHYKSGWSARPWYFIAANMNCGDGGGGQLRCGVRGLSAAKSKCQNTWSHNVYQMRRVPSARWWPQETRGQRKKRNKISKIKNECSDALGRAPARKCQNDFVKRSVIIAYSHVCAPIVARVCVCVSVWVLIIFPFAWPI